MMIRTTFLAAAWLAASPAFGQASEFGPAAEASAAAQSEDPCVGLEDCGDVPDFEQAGGGQSLFGGEITLLSDYRFRGISRSDEDPALQAAVTVFPFPGVYAGVRGTTLKGTDSFRERDPAFQDLGDVELDLYAGYGAQLGGGFDVDAGLQYYVFAGGDGPTDYAEPYASLSYLIGPVSATAGAKYAPEQ
ncbi:MAG TPA: TorF family putative porin, partial [Allosphingosinicella sp.]|nr:TorF family putative porin [Allosphingosinicella sp.]